MNPRFPLVAALLLAGCGQPVADTVNQSASANLTDADVTEVVDESMPENTAVAVESPVDAWTGKWTGVEGLALTIAPGESPETRKLTISLLDGTNSYAGTVKGDTITFERAGQTETIRAGTGAETGLKYLAGKQNCLVIKSGEGFCRD